MSMNRMREGLRALRAAGDTTSFEGMDPDGEMPPFMVPTTSCPRWWSPTTSPTPRSAR
jgi:hypothetical protein